MAGIPFGGPPGTTNVDAVLLIAADAVALARASAVAGALPVKIGLGIGLLKSDGGGAGWNVVTTDVGVGTIHSSDGDAGREVPGVRENGVRLPTSTSESSSSSNQSDCLGEGIVANTAFAAVGVTTPDCGRWSSTTESTCEPPSLGVGGSGEVGGGFRGEGGRPEPCDDRLKREPGDRMGDDGESRWFEVVPGMTGARLLSVRDKPGFDDRVDLVDGRRSMMTGMAGTGSESEEPFFFAGG